jgi:hypothetical protein
MTDYHLLWDKIVSITPIGYEHVYDIEVEGTHNFVAEGIVAHKGNHGVTLWQVTGNSKG